MSTWKVPPTSHQSHDCNTENVPLPCYMLISMWTTFWKKWSHLCPNLKTKTKLAHFARRFSYQYIILYRPKKYSHCDKFFTQNPKHFRCASRVEKYAKKQDLPCNKHKPYPSPYVMLLLGLSHTKAFVRLAHIFRFVPITTLLWKATEVVLASYGAHSDITGGSPTQPTTV